MITKILKGIALGWVLAMQAAPLPDDCSQPELWVLEPAPAVQKHAFEIRDGALFYDAGGSGQHTYSQLMRTDPVAAKSANRFEKLRFSLQGDGSGAEMKVLLYGTDGVRWQHPVLLESSEWRDVELSLRDFQLDPHGNQTAAGSGAWPDTRLISAIGFLFEGTTPHRIGLDNLDWQGSADMTSSPVQIEFYPATTHRGGKSFLIPGEVLPLIIFAGGFEGISNPVLEFSLPPGVKLRDASITSNTAGRTVNCEALDANRWRIPLDAGVAVPGKISKFQETLNLFLHTDSGQIPGDAQISWRMLHDGGELTAGDLSVEILPPLPPVEALQRQVRLYTYTTILFASPQPEVRKAMAQTLEHAGISGGVIYPSDPAPTQELSERGWLLLRHAFNWWDNWGVWAEELSAPAEEKMAVLANGSYATMPGALCPEWLLAHTSPEDEYYQKAQEYLKQALMPGIAGFLNDHEMIWESELSPRKSCFDARCIRAFAEFSGIPADTLNAEVILQQHRDLWYNFHHARQGRLIAFYNELVKSLNPEFKTAICSYPVTPFGETPTIPAAYDAWIDEHWPMCYKSGVSLHRDIENTLAALHAPVTVLLNNCDPIGERVYIPPQEFALNLYGAMTSGVRGVGIFTGDISLDGEYLSIINRIANRALPLESWVIDGVRADDAFDIAGVPERIEKQKVLDQTVDRPQPDWQPALRSRVFSSGESFLVLAYNYSGLDNGLLSVAMPNSPHPMAVYDRKNQTRILSPSGADSWSREELQIGIPVRFGAWDDIELEVAPRPAAHWRDRTLRPDQIRTDWRRACTAPREAQARLAVSTRPEKRPLKSVDGKGTPQETAEVTFRADRENLYVSILCQDAQIIGGDTGDDVAVWSADCGEILITDGKDSYYHFGVNASGGRYDAKDRDQSWNGDWQGQATCDADGWRADFVIPWATLNLSGIPAVNFARENAPQGELSSLMPNGGDFHRRDCFIEMNLENCD